MSQVPNPPVEEPTPNPVEGENPKTDSVSYESHRKLLDEKKKLDERIRQIEDEKKAEQEAKLIEDGKLKEALDLKEKELQEAQTKLTNYEEQRRDAKKMSAIIDGLGVPVDKKWLSIIGDKIHLVDIDESGNVDAKQCKQVCDVLLKDWPEMIKKEPANMPNGTPRGGSTTITRSDWLKLSDTEMLKWKPDQII